MNDEHIVKRKQKRKSINSNHNCTWSRNNSKNSFNFIFSYLESCPQPLHNKCRFQFWLDSLAKFRPRSNPDPLGNLCLFLKSADVFHYYSFAYISIYYTIYYKLFIVSYEKNDSFWTVIIALDQFLNIDQLMYFNWNKPVQRCKK